MTYLDRRITEQEINTNVHVIVRGTKQWNINLKLIFL